MADIRSFFSPKSLKPKSSSSNIGAKQETSRNIKSKNGQKKTRLSSSPESTKTKTKSSAKEVKKKGAKRTIVISESDDDDNDGDFVKKKLKKPKKSHDSESEEDPLPKGLRRSASKKKESSKSKSKKSAYFDESDDDDEAPINVKKLSKSVEKASKPELKKNKLVKPVKPVSPVKPVKPEKPVTPVKKSTTVDDFFGSAPIHRMAGKTAPTKRKQPFDEDTPEKQESVKSSQSKAESRHDHCQPIKKRKEDKSSVKKSPAKKEEPTLSNKLAKAVAASNAIIIVPDTPTSEKKNVKTKPQKTPSPSKPAKESPKKKPVTPQAVHEEDAPASLEKKKSSYRNFMQREGPKALGSKEIPQGEDNCFEGMTFVITGILETIEREQTQDIIQRYGGKVTQSVSKKTSYVIIGRDPGPSKTSKANTLGTKIIDEDGFFNLIKTTPGKKSAYEQTPEKPPAKKPKTSVKESPLAKPSTPKPSKDAHLSIQASTSMVESQNSQKSTSSLASPATQTPSGSPVVKEESLMWVDKYKPQNIKQIIGQQGDKSNMRKLMNWVNNWNKNRRKTHPKTSFFQKDQDGAIHKAALLSGPPGVGKTTTAVLVCREMGYSYVEMNASDSRNKKCLEQHVSQLLSNKTMDAFVGGSESVCQDASKHILIMDEVDGMAGNEDRGGMQELISLIKGSKIPIICMCNDRNSQKIRSLVNYCFDLRFQRPRVEQIKGAMLSIAFKEGLKIPPPAMDQIILGANQDIRQVLHNMSMWSSTNKKMTYDQAKDDASKAHKDIKMGPFDAIRKLLSFESFKLSLIDKSDLFFCDYSLMPLFVQENYLSVRPSKAEGNIIKCLELVSKSADSISDGDLVEKQIRSRASWSLLPTQAIFSSVIPSYFIGGGMDQRIDFPQWLGKNSKRGRLDRILQELQCHMRLRTSADKACINLDYIPHLRNSLTLPLMDEVNAKEGVTGIIQLLQAYDLTREDWDSIMEAGQYQGHRDPMTRIPSKVKAAFTRAYNKDHHKTPYALKSALSKSRGKSHDMESSQGDGNEEEHDEEEEESLENSAMLVKNKKPASRAKGSKEQQSKGKGKGKGPKT